MKVLRSDEDEASPPMPKRSHSNLALLVSDLSPKAAAEELPKVARRKSHGNLTSLVRSTTESLGFISKILTQTRDVSTGDEKVDEADSKIAAILERQKKTQAPKTDAQKLNRRRSSRRLLTEDEEDSQGGDADKRMDRSRRSLSRTKIRDAAMVRPRSRSRQGRLMKSSSRRQLDGEHRSQRSSRLKLDEQSSSSLSIKCEGRRRRSPKSTRDMTKNSLQSGESGSSQHRDHASDADQMKRLMNRRKERSSRSLNKQRSSRPLNKQGSSRSLSGLGSLEGVTSKNSRRMESTSKDGVARSGRSLTGLALLDERNGKCPKDGSSSNDETAPASEITLSVVEDISCIDIHMEDDDEIARTTKSSVWMCTCGEETELMYKHCGMCGNKRNWACGVCSFEKNMCKFKFCGECGAAKQEEEEEED